MTLYPALLGAVTIDSSNKAILFSEDGAAETVNVAEGTYFLRGDGASDDLCLALKTAFDSHPGAGNQTYTVTIARSTTTSSAHGTVTIARATQNLEFQVLWTNAATTFDEALIGFSGDTSSDTSAKVSTLSPSAQWVSPEVYTSLEPTPFYRRTSARATGGQFRAVSRAGEVRDRVWVQEWIEERRMLEEAIAADPTRALSRFIARHADGKRFELHTQTSTSGTLGALSSSTLLGTYHFSDDFYPDEGGTFTARAHPGLAMYSFEGLLAKYVA